VVELAAVCDAIATLLPQVRIAVATGQNRGSGRPRAEGHPFTGTDLRSSNEPHGRSVAVATKPAGAPRRAPRAALV